MNYAGLPARLGLPRDRRVQRPVDLEGAKPATVSPDLGEAAGWEGIRAGQPDHQLGAERSACHGTGASSAQSTLKVPSPRRYRRIWARLRAGKASGPASRITSWGPSAAMTARRALKASPAASTPTARPCSTTIRR